MPEVPNFKHYLQRFGGGGGGSTTPASPPYAVMVDLLNVGVAQQWPVRADGLDTNEIWTELYPEFEAAFEQASIANPGLPEEAVAQNVAATLADSREWSISPDLAIMQLGRSLDTLVNKFNQYMADNPVR